jgi:hypothetical protein
MSIIPFRNERNSVGGASLVTVFTCLFRGWNKISRGSQGLLAIALPEQSPLKRPIDEALVKITSHPEWISIEDRFFGK